MPAWIAPAIAGVSQLMNSGISALRQGAEFRQNRRMADYMYGKDLEQWNRQNTWNRQMWDLQNEYNLPSNQMKRLRDAGLNPNLIYGNAAAGGQATSIQKAESPKYSQVRANYTHQPVNVPEIIGMYQNLKVADAQIDNLKAQQMLTTERALTEAAIRNSRLTKAGHDAARAGYDTDIKYRQSQYVSIFQELDAERRRRQLANMEADRLLKYATLPRTRAEAGIRQKELDWMSGFSGARPQDLTRFLEQFLRMMLRR